MPKTRNFSDPEKRHATNRLNIHDNFNAATCLEDQPTRRRWRKKLRCGQNATLSEKGFPLSDKRTMSAKFLTNQKLSDNLMFTPAPPFNSRQTPTSPAKTPIMPITTGVANTIDMTTSTLASKNLCALCGESPSMEFGICPVSLKFTTPQLSIACKLSAGFAKLMPIHLL